MPGFLSSPGIAFLYPFDARYSHRYYRFHRILRTVHLMKLAYFDCFSGISGDMTLGALVDAGVPIDHLRSELKGLAVLGWQISAERVWKNGMSATHVKVNTEDTQTHRSLTTILGIFDDSKLSASVKTRAAAIFRKL